MHPTIRFRIWILFLLAPALIAAAIPETALEGLDPVLLLEGREAPGEEGLIAEADGFTYRFTSEETRSRFLTDPGRFAFQGRGQCAVMPQARAHGDLYAVHEGRLYGFGSRACRAKFLAAPAEYTGAENRKLRVAMVLFEGVELLDFAGPGEVFAAARGGRAFEVFTVSADGEPVTSQGFVTVDPTHAMAQSPPADVLVIPGGRIGSLLGNEAAMRWLGERAASAQVVLSVCNGALVLARAGLLEGLEATTHAGSLDTLRSWAPRTVLRPERRFVDNGKVVTSAGVSAGIDASLHLVRRLAGEGAAMDTARYMEYSWEPEPVAAAAAR